MSASLQMRSSVIPSDARSEFRTCRIHSCEAVKLTRKEWHPAREWHSDIMTYKKRNYDEYEENDFYDESNEREEIEDINDVTEDEKISEEEYDDDDFDDSEDEDSLPAKLQPFYDKSNPTDFVQIMKDYKSGNRDKESAACEQALISLEGLIRHIIKTKYAKYSARFFDDLLQQGRLGVCKGLTSYDPSQSKPATFFYYYILHEMQEWVNSMINKTTSHYDASMRKIKKVIDKYQKEGRHYTAVDIAIDTNLPLQTVEQSIQMINSSETSIEGMLDSIGSLENILPSTEKSPEQLFLEEENVRVLDEAINRYLDEQETRVIELMYGIHGCPIMSNKMISKKLDMPTDRIRRFQITALCKLRQCKELKYFHRDMLKDTLIEIDEDNAVPLLSDINLDDALEIMKDVDIDF